MIELFDWYAQIFTKENLELFNVTHIPSILTAGAVVIAPLTYVIKRWLTNKAEKKTISESLYVELQDSIQSLKGAAKRQVMEIEVEGETMYYTLASLHYDMYDSLIFSGKIQLLDKTIQQEIQDVFRIIKEHQDYLRYTFLLRDQSKIHNADIDKITDSYYAMIAEDELKIEQLIPKIMKKLKENF